MASAADVRSVLSVQLPLNSGPPLPKKPHVFSRKPEGISRELYSLIGPSAPSLAAHLAKPRLKQKPFLGGAGKVKWEWRPFKNGARSDAMRLHHWVKVGTDLDAEYPFAKYNSQPTSYTYSQDEYSRLLEDPQWTKEETDYLFKIACEHDLRWYVIHDRYDYPNGVPRALEDLKDRYYGVCRKVVRSRPWAGDEQSKAQLLASFQFDKEREATRKKYISSLENRTADQIAEEEALYIEVKRLEQNERRYKKERDDLLRTLAGVESGLPDLPIEEEGLTAGGFGSGGNGSSLTLDSRKKKRGLYDLDSPTTPSNVIALGPPIHKKQPQSAKNTAFDAIHYISRTELPSAAVPGTKGAHQSAHLRSFKIPAPKASIAPKITQALAEIGVQHTRLVMPTKENLTQLDMLLDATCALIETKKVVDRVEQDIRVMKTRLGLRQSEPQEEGKAEAEREGEQVTPMDVDAEDRDAEGEPDEERASVVSTRSGRSRKRVRRSTSVSSVETSATVSTRAGFRKQQRG